MTVQFVCISYVHVIWASGYSTTLIFPSDNIKEGVVVKYRSARFGSLGINSLTWGIGPTTHSDDCRCHQRTNILSQTVWNEIGSICVTKIITQLMCCLWFQRDLSIIGWPVGMNFINYLLQNRNYTYAVILTETIIAIDFLVKLNTQLYAIFYQCS